MNTRPRFLRQRLEQLVEHSPVVLLKGARQVGKSTLAGVVGAGRDARFVTLDDPTDLALAASDPRGFLNQAGRGGLLVIDEVQRAPELVLPIKAMVDAQQRAGSFLLTGSSDLFADYSAGDSLAGRLLVANLKPYSAGELTGRATPEDFIDWIMRCSEGDGDVVDSAQPDALELEHPPLIEMVASGGYPRVATMPTSFLRDEWFKGYLEQIVSHDILGEIGRKDVVAMRKMLRYVAAHPSQELVKTKVARAIDSSPKVVGGLLDTAERMFLIEQIPAWSSDFGQRSVKTPKFCLVDTGLAAFLSGFSPQMADRPGSREYFGHLLEQWVVQQLLAQQGWSQRRFTLNHYRTKDGAEVDVVVEFPNGQLILIEVKATSTPRVDQAHTLRRLKATLGDRVVAGIIFHTGSTRASVDDWLHVLPVDTLYRHS